MVNIPQVQIGSGKGAREPNLDALTAAFDAKVLAEREKESPIISAARGANAVQGVIQGQQDIENNREVIESNRLGNAIKETELAKKQLSTRQALEAEKENKKFLDAISSGSLNDQFNALVNTRGDIVARNKEAADSVADRIERQGSSAMQQGIRELYREKYSPEITAQKQKEEKFRRAASKRNAREQAQLDATGEPPNSAQSPAVKERKRQLREQKAKAERAKKSEPITVLSDRQKAEQKPLFELAQFLHSSGKKREAQLLETRAARALTHAREAGFDEATVEKQVAERALQELSASDRAEFRRVLDDAAANRVQQRLGTGEGSVVPSGQLSEQEAISKGLITEVSLNRRAAEIVNQTKTLARRQGLTIIVNDDALFIKAKQKVLAQIQAANG